MEWEKEIVQESVLPSKKLGLGHKLRFVLSLFANDNILIKNTCVVKETTDEDSSNQTVELLLAIGAVKSLELYWAKKKGKRRAI